MKKVIITIMILFVVFISSCVSGPDKNAAVSFTDTRWILTEVDGSPVPVVGNDLMREPFVLFQTEDMRFSGCGGVNNLMGAFQLNEGKLSLSGVARTMMAGPGLDFEDKFVRALNAINTYTVTGDGLVLSKDGASPLLHFKAVTASASAF